MLLVKHRGRSKRVSVGPVSLKGIAEMRQEYHERRARAEPEGEAREPEVPERTALLFRDLVAGAWKEAQLDKYKPSTRRSTGYALTCFLSGEEIARLHKVLDEEAGRGERFRQ